MYALGIVLFALAIGVSIMLHEAGHMLTAKRYGMKVTQYFVGFGPTLWSFRRGETEYGVKAIPAGGFVKIVGMTPQEVLDPEDEPRAMWRQPLSSRTVVLAAGSLTHFALAILLVYACAVFVKLPNPEWTAQAEQISAGTEVGYLVECFTPEGTSVVDEPCDGKGTPGPGAAAGLEVGDDITAVRGAAVTDWSELVTAISKLPAGEPAAFAVDRGGSPTALTITPVQVPVQTAAGKPTDQNRTVVGIGAPRPTVPTDVSYGPIAAIPATSDFMGEFVKGTFRAIGNFPSKVPGLVDAVRGEDRDPEGPISVVGASRIGGDALDIGGRTGAEVFLLILASLNLFIGVFNLFPLLPLDGGHIAIAWYEKVRSWWAARRGKPDPGRVDYNKLMPLTFAVILVFGAISLLAITADIINPIRLG
jgi:membrane-associated protease RseP (regulator of RpoE activity)